MINFLLYTKIMKYMLKYLEKFTNIYMEVKAV